MDFETDQTLLRRFHQCADQQAFAELVRRHAGLVHTAALRQVGRMDQHLAEDVTQAVFQVLAYKTRVTTAKRSLASWLLTVTRCAAIDAVRKRAAERRHEQIAAAHRPEVQMDTTSSLTTEAASAEWDRIAPFLDAAMAELPERDRDAMVMRYFQDMSFADIAQSLEISESAARKRIARAIAKLREKLGTHGANVNAAAIGSLLTVYSVGLTPPANVTAAAVAAPACASVGLSSIAKGAITMMAWSKAKLVGVVAALVILAFGAGAFVLAQANANSSTSPSTLPAADVTPDWRAGFDRVYQLEDGQLLKNIPPPYIPERDAFVREFLPYPNPDSIFFRWDGKLKSWGFGYGTGDPSVRGVMVALLKISNDKFEAPRSFSEFKIAGDWIVRDKADTAASLDELCRIVRDKGGPNVRFQKELIEREAFVVRGQFAFKSIEESYNPKWVHLYVGVPDKDESAGGGSGDLSLFLRMLGSRMGTPLIDEVTGERPKSISWGTHFSVNHSDLGALPAGAERDARIHELLNRVSQQTGLEFVREDQKLPIWVGKESES